VFTVLASLQRGAGPAPAQGRRSGAPDSLRAGLADPPEYWQAANPCDAVTVLHASQKSAVLAGTI